MFLTGCSSLREKARFRVSCGTRCRSSLVLVSRISQKINASISFFPVSSSVSWEFRVTIHFSSVGKDFVVGCSPKKPISPSSPTSPPFLSPVIPPSSPPAQPKQRFRWSQQVSAKNSEKKLLGCLTILFAKSWSKLISGSLNKKSCSTISIVSNCHGDKGFAFCCRLCYKITTSTHSSLLGKSKYVCTHSRWLTFSWCTKGHPVDKTHAGLVCFPIEILINLVGHGILAKVAASSVWFLWFILNEKSKQSCCALSKLKTFNCRIFRFYFAGLRGHKASVRLSLHLLLIYNTTEITRKFKTTKCELAQKLKGRSCTFLDHLATVYNRKWNGI